MSEELSGEKRDTERVTRVLTTLRRRIRRAQWRRAAWACGCAALGGLLLVMVAEFTFAPVAAGWRWTLFFLWLAGFLAVGVSSLRPLFRPLGLVGLARWVETHSPHMEERMSSALELARDREAGESGDLVALVTAAAEIDADGVDPGRELRRLRIGRGWGWTLLGLLASLAIPALLWPRSTGQMIARALMPGSERGNAASWLQVKPGDLEAMVGDEVEIRATVRGRALRQLQVEVIFADGNSGLLPMEKVNGAWVLHMAAVGQTFRYRVRAGRLESDFYQARVWPLPKLADAEVSVIFPAYTGLAERKEPLGSEVRALVGGRVKISGKVGTEVLRAWLAVAGDEAGRGTLTGTGTTMRAAWDFPVERPGSSRVELRVKHRLGGEFSLAETTVVVKEDEPPVVELLSPEKEELQVRPEEVIRIKYRTRDDFGVTRILLEATGGESVRAALDLEMPAQLDTMEGGAEYLGEAGVPAGEWSERLGGAREWRIRVAAEDARPVDLGGPGRGNSRWLKVRLEEGGPSLARQEMRADYEAAHKALNEAQQQLQEAKSTLEWGQEQLSRRADEPQTQELADRVAENMEQGRRTLEELSEQLDPGIHKQTGEEAQAALEKVEAAQEAFQQSALAEDGAERGERVAEARQELNEMLEQLNATRQELDRRQRQAEDLAGLAELAARQRELARQMVSHGAEVDSESESRLRQQQFGLEAEVADTVQSRPQARAQALAGMKEEMQSLAQEARANAEAQSAFVRQGDASEPPGQEEVRRQMEAVRERGTETGEQPGSQAGEQPGPQAGEQPGLQGGEELGPQAGEQPGPQAGEQPGLQTEQESVSISGEGGALSSWEQQRQQASQALENGRLTEASRELAELAAAQSAATAKEVDELSSRLAPEVGGAQQQARRASEQAGQAAASGKEEAGRPQASQRHQDAAQSWDQTAQQLEQAARALENRAEAAAGEQSPPHQVPADAAALAQAAQETAKAARSENRNQAGQAATRAAEALEQAVRAGREALRGDPAQGEPQGASQMAQSQARQAPPGEGPPQDARQLATKSVGQAEGALRETGDKLGQWEKIQSNLSSEVGAGREEAIPEDYRELVRKYFEEMSR